MNRLATAPGWVPTGSSRAGFGTREFLAVVRGDDDDLPGMSTRGFRRVAMVDRLPCAGTSVSPPERVVRATPESARPAEVSASHDAVINEGDDDLVWTLGPHRLTYGDPSDPEVLARLLGVDVVDIVIGEPSPGQVMIDGVVADARQIVARVVSALRRHTSSAAVAVVYAHVRHLVSLVRAGAGCLADPARGRSLPPLPAVAMLVHAQADPSLELAELLAACSPERAIVVDPFARTAAVLTAAQSTQRRARLVCPTAEICRDIAAQWRGAR